MDFNALRGNGPFTMSPTLVLPELIRSLPSPSPSVAFKSSASSVGTMDDLAIPTLGNPSGLSFTLSPPESLATLEDIRDVSTGQDPFSSSFRESDSDNTPALPDKLPIKGMHGSPKITYLGRVNSKGTKRPASEVEIYDSRNSTSLEPVSRKRVKVVGLKNLGNTCYNNAVIQALSHTCAFREYFLQRQPPVVEGSDGSTNSSDPLVRLSLNMGRPRTRRAARLEEQVVVPANVNLNLCDEFSRLLKMMWVNHTPTQVATGPRSRRSATPVISPHMFASAVARVLPSFHERHEQQDAQEFLRCALERMQDELASEQIEEEDTIVQNVFGGILWDKIICQSCSEHTIKADPFLDLSLVIPELSPQASKHDIRPNTLEECLNLFSTTEEIEGSPSPPGSVSSSTTGSGRSCLSCGSDAAFAKAITFGILPNVLCIHLKRFRWRSHNARGGKQKVDTHVSFPLEGLDMKTWCEEDIDGPILYDLYAVVVHQGTDVNYGHYFAYTKHQGDWWWLNDDRATKVSPGTVEKSKAYLLFYKRREVELSPSSLTDNEPIAGSIDSCTEIPLKSSEDSSSPEQP